MKIVYSCLLCIALFACKTVSKKEELTQKAFLLKEARGHFNLCNYTDAENYYRAVLQEDSFSSSVISEAQKRLALVEKHFSQLYPMNVDLAEGSLFPFYPQQEIGSQWDLPSFRAYNLTVIEALDLVQNLLKDAHARGVNKKVLQLEYQVKDFAIHGAKRIKFFFDKRTDLAEVLRSLQMQLSSQFFYRYQGEKLYCYAEIEDKCCSGTNFFDLSDKLADDFHHLAKKGVNDFFKLEGMKESNVQLEADSAALVSHNKYLEDAELLKTFIQQRHYYRPLRISQRRYEHRGRSKSDIVPSNLDLYNSQNYILQEVDIRDLNEATDLKLNGIEKTLSYRFRKGKLDLLWRDFKGDLTTELFLQSRDFVFSLGEEQFLLVEIRAPRLRLQHIADPSYALSTKQIESLLRSDDVDTKKIVLSRQDLDIPELLLRELLLTTTVDLRALVIARSEYEVSSKELDLGLGDVNAVIRQAFLSKLDKPSVEQLDRGLRDNEADLRSLWVERFAYLLSEKQLEQIVRDPSPQVRAALAKSKSFTPSLAQIEKGLHTSDLDVEMIWAYHLEKFTYQDFADFELALNSRNKQIRLSCASSKNYQVTSGHLEIGLHHWDPEVRVEFTLRADFQPNAEQMKLGLEDRNGLVRKAWLERVEIEKRKKVQKKLD